MNFVFLNLDQRNIQFLQDVLQNPIALIALATAFVAMVAALYDPLIAKRGRFTDIFKSRISTVMFMTAIILILLVAILVR